MAGHGPPREAHRFKVMKGTAGRRPEHRAPKAPIAAPSCPEFLDPVARQEWRRIVPLLLEAGSIAKLDRATLSAYCAAWSRFKAATLALQERGTTQRTKQGITRRPETAIAAEAEKSLRALGDALGLSPVSRTRLDFAPPPEKDPILGW